MLPVKLVNALLNVTKGMKECGKPVMCFWKVGGLVGRGLLMPLSIRNGFLQWKNTLPTGKPVPNKREKVAA